jgi:hypothetical protein
MNCSIFRGKGNGLYNPLQIDVTVYLYCGQVDPNSSLVPALHLYSIERINKSICTFSLAEMLERLKTTGI